MATLKAFKFRLYPNKEQQGQLARQFGACRFVWNHYLRQRIDYYAETGKGLNYYDNARDLTQLKREPGHIWLREANAQSLQQSLQDLTVAYTNFFAKRARFPRFKRKKARQSFRVPQHFRLENRCLIIPKVSPIRMVIHRSIEGRMKSVTISRVPSGKYFASILCEVEMSEPEYSGSEIGIDLGLTHFIVTSDGEKIDAPKFFRKAERRQVRLQRILSRRQKGSAGWIKARLAVARQREHIANQRADFLHKLSRRLVDENQVIGVETLNVKGMLANHRLAKSISDAGWGEFVRQLGYKGGWYGCRVHQVDRFFPSSKRCHICGHINEALQLSHREWICPECGTVHDRDVNAAINILTFGTAGTAETVPTPVESEIACSLKPEAPPLTVEQFTVRR